MIATKLTRSIALAGSVSVLLFGAPIAQAEVLTGGYGVAIALDEALTRPLHLGKRYVASGKFQAARQQGKVLTLEARAGHPAAQWNAQDKSVVTVSPPRGEKVTIRVKRCDAQTRVNVTSPAGSRTLSITTICDADTIRADITQ